MPPDPDSSKGSGMVSLYADLLEKPSDNNSSTISRGPVVFKQSSEADTHSDEPAVKKQQLSAAHLRFQPTKRPQLPSQKPKQKPTLPKTVPGTSPGPAPAPAAASPPIKTSLADWAAAEDDDVNGFYVGEKRQRGGRKKRKKNRESQAMVQNWDDIYDPSRPNNYEDYKNSDEKIAEVREWKDRLYAHRMRARSSDLDSDEEYSRPMNRQFAPPSTFAPPPNLNAAPPSEPPVSEPEPTSGEDVFTQRLQMSQNQGDSPMPDYPAHPPPPPPPENDEHPGQTPDAPTGDDAYTQRLRMTMTQPTGPVTDATPPVPQAPPSRPLDQLQPDSASISRAPVRYTLPPPPEDIPASEAELEEVFAKEQPAQEGAGEGAPRSLRPGQKGFAERLLEKYGWTKGSGLGANESGMTKPLQVKVEKPKKRPDSEGGGFATPAGRGKIIGGGGAKKSDDVGKFGPMSEVVVLKGMLNNMDLEAELDSDQDVGLMQEIGEECSQKYGVVERVFIHRDSDQVPVFVKFTSQLSALRAVNALEGRIFNGNAITARFFNKEKFENGVYEE